MKSQIQKGSPIFFIFFVFIATRFLVWYIAYCGTLLFGIKSGALFWHAFPANLLIDIWGRWDSNFYLSVSQYWYPYYINGAPNTSFLPLYPIIIKFIHQITGNYLTAGIITSNTAFLIALFYLYKLTETISGQSTAQKSVFYLCIFPTTYFTMAVYGEALFILTAVAAFYHARQKQWLIAGIWGAAAGATRIFGLILFAALIFEYLSQKNFQLKNISVDLIGLLIMPLGFLAYILIMYKTTGDISQFLSAHKGAGRILAYPWVTFYKSIYKVFTSNFALGRCDIHNILDIILISLFLLTSLITINRLPFSLTIFGVGSILFALSSYSPIMPLYSVSRFMINLPALFISLSIVGEQNNYIDKLIIVFFLLNLALFSIAFATWRWAF